MTANQLIQLSIISLLLSVSGAQASQFSACPETNNCVNSDSQTEIHKIDPIHANGSLEASWESIIAYLKKESSFKIVEQSDNYLKAEATTSILRFTDDVEFEKRSQEHIIAVRSASRIGQMDFGTNRKRIEALKAHIAALKL